MERTGRALRRPATQRLRNTCGDGTIAQGSSGLNLLKRWIQAFQLHLGVGRCEVPVGLGVVVVAA